MLRWESRGKAATLAVKTTRNLPEPQKAKKRNRRFFLNSGAGLGIISTINILFVIGFVGIYLKQIPHKIPLKYRFGFVMVITIETVLKERGLRYVSKSLCNARMDWFTFLTEITLSEWSDRVIFKPADASPRKYTQLLIELKVIMLQICDFISSLISS